MATNARHLKKYFPPNYINILVLTPPPFNVGVPQQYVGSKGMCSLLRRRLVGFYSRPPTSALRSMKFLSPLSRNKPIDNAILPKFPGKINGQYQYYLQTE